jgi:hypothetical protein
MAMLMSRLSGGPTQLGVNWVSRLFNRHPEIKSKVGVKIEALRVRNTNPESLQVWFDLVHDVIARRKIKTTNMWNMDETGIALGVCSNQLVIGTSSTNRSYVQRPENREWVSIIESISADGGRTRSLVIFKGKSVQST